MRFTEDDRDVFSHRMQLAGWPLSLITAILDKAGDPIMRPTPLPYCCAGCGVGIVKATGGAAAPRHVLDDGALCAGSHRPVLANPSQVPTRLALVGGRWVPRRF